MSELTLQRRDTPALRYWDDGGDRPRMMLIHGVGAEGTSREQIAAALSPDFRVMRLDLRGHGRSGHIAGALTLDDFVRDVVDVLDVCSVPAAHIVGFSLGGMIAQGTALRHTKRVLRLVLLSVVAGRTAEECQRVAGTVGHSARAGYRRDHRRSTSVGSCRRSSPAIPIWSSGGCGNCGRTTRHPTPSLIRCSRPAIWAIDCMRSVPRS